jgi:protein-tyrosine phosphatase
MFYILIYVATEHISNFQMRLREALLDNHHTTNLGRTQYSIYIADHVCRYRL